MDAYRKAGSPIECRFYMDRNLNFYVDEDPKIMKGCYIVYFCMNALLSDLYPEHKEHEIKRIAMKFYRGLDE
jgi:hypothetical protein